MEMLGMKKWILDIARQKETAETEVQSRALNTGYSKVFLVY